ETQYSPVLGTACALFGLASSNLDYDPQAGLWAAESSLTGVMDSLLDYQHPTGGGFVFSTQLTPPLQEGDQDLQSTIYAILAMKALDVWRYSIPIAAAENWIWSMQLPNGGFLSYLSGYENIQANGEAIWALLYEQEPWNDGDGNGDKKITPEDSQIAFKIYLGMILPTWRQFRSADCDGNGSVTSDDAQCIWKHVLALGCDCVDEIVISPTCSKRVAVTKPIQMIPNGQLIAVVENNEEVATITINTDNTKVNVDSLGFHINVPASWKLRNSDFGNELRSWNNFDAVQNGNTIVVGAWNIMSSISDDHIATLTFDVKPDLSSHGVEITNLVDDIADFIVVVK
ncbi:hypothetical protein K8T06_09915, partial [bacterium]|nr:hypothetical protein [bacterium]